MKKIVSLFISLFVLQQNLTAGPIFSRILEPMNDNFDEEYIDSSLDLFSRCLEAIYKNEIDLVKYILFIQPDIVHQQDELGLTPLHRALISQDDNNMYKINHSIVSVLVENGANTEIEDSEGTSPRDLVEAYKSKLECDYSVSHEDYARIAKIYQSISPNSPQFRKRFR